MCKIYHGEELRTEVKDGVFIKDVVVSNTSERKMVISTPLNDSSVNVKQRKFSSRASLEISKCSFPKNGMGVTVFSEVSDVKRESEEIVSLTYQHPVMYYYKRVKKKIEVSLNGD